MKEREGGGGGKGITGEGIIPLLYEEKKRFLYVSVHNLCYCREHIS